MVFARREAKKEPCPQSWKKMKMRTIRPAATTLMASVNQ
jgi:hypothetical protein